MHTSASQTNKPSFAPRLQSEGRYCPCSTDRQGEAQKWSLILSGGPNLEQIWTKLCTSLPQSHSSAGICWIEAGVTVSLLSFPVPGPTVGCTSNCRESTSEPPQLEHARSLPRWERPTCTLLTCMSWNGMEDAQLLYQVWKWHMCHPEPWVAKRLKLREDQICRDFKLLKLKEVSTELELKEKSCLFFFKCIMHHNFSLGLFLEAGEQFWLKFSNSVIWALAIKCKLQQQNVVVTLRERWKEFFVICIIWIGLKLIVQFSKLEKHLMNIWWYKCQAKTLVNQLLFLVDSALHPK